MADNLLNGLGHFILYCGMSGMLWMISNEIHVLYGIVMNILCGNEV